MGNERKVFETADQLQLQKVLDALKIHQIPTCIKENGAGECVDITMGVSNQSKEIYVLDTDMVEADCVVQHCLRDKDEVKPTIQQVKPVWYQNRVVVARSMIGLILCVGVLTVVATIL